MTINFDNHLVYQNGAVGISNETKEKLETLGFKASTNTRKYVYYTADKKGFVSANFKDNVVYKLGQLHIMPEYAPSQSVTVSYYEDADCALVSANVGTKDVTLVDTKKRVFRVFVTEFFREYGVINIDELTEEFIEVFGEETTAVETKADFDLQKFNKEENKMKIEEIKNDETKIEEENTMTDTTTYIANKVETAIANGVEELGNMIVNNIKAVERQNERRALRRSEKGLVFELCGDKLTERGVLPVYTSRDFEHIQNRVKRIYNEEYDIPALFVRGDKDTLRTAQSAQVVPANYLTTLIEKHVRHELLYNIHGQGKNMRRCFMGQMYLVIENNGVFNANLTNYGMLGKIVAVLIDGRHWVYAFDVPGKATVRIVSKHPYKDLGINPEVNRAWLYKNTDGTVRDRYEYDFEYSLCSPGAKKKNGIILWGKHVGPDTSRDYSRQQIMDLATCGSWSMQQYLGRGIWSNGAADTAKLGSRYSQILAPQSVLMDTVAIPSVLFLGGKQKVDYKDMVGLEACDGIGYMMASWLAFSLNQMAEFAKDYVTEGAVTGCQIQMRPWTMKGTALTITLEMLCAVLKQLNYILKKGVILVNGDTCDLETRIAVYNFTVSGGKEGKYAGMGGIEVVYPSELKKFMKDGKQLWPTVKIETVMGKQILPAPALIADANCIKTGVDPKYKSGGRFMNMSHCHKFFGRSSVQTLQSLAMVNYEATKNYVATASTAMVETEEAKIFGKESRALEASDIKANGEIDWMSAMEKVTPALYNECGRPAFMKTAEKSVEGLSTKFEALNFKVPNVTQMLMPDLGALLFGKPIFRTIMKNVLGKKMTDIVEVYTTTLPAHTEGIMYRFPKCGTGEFVKVRNLSKQDILRRYRGIEREMISELLNALGAGIVSIAADPRILNALGGADFDGDKVKFFMGPVIESDTETTAEDLKGFENTDFGILCDQATVVLDKDA